MRVNEYRFGDFRLLVDARELWRDAEPVALPRRVFDALLYLIEHRERAVGRDELAAAVWGRADISDAQVGQLVMRVRRVLGDDGQAQAYVRTLTGFGYRWIGPAAAAPADVGPGPPADAGPVSATAPPPAGFHAPSRPRMRVRARLAIIAALLIAIVIAVALAATISTYDHDQDEPPPRTGSIAVLPLSVDGPPGHGWIRLGVMDLVADRLRGAGLPVAQSDRTLAMLARHPAAADASGAGEEHDPRRQLAAFPAEAQTTAVVSGRAQRTADGWTLELSYVDDGDAGFRQHASHADVLVAGRSAADQLLAALGALPPQEAPLDAALDERLRRAQAALLANELDTARTILLADDSAAADPEIAFRLAQVDYRAGRLDEAAATYDRLAADPAVGADPRLLSRVLRARGTLNIRRGDDAGAERDFDAAASRLGDLDAPGELGWALNGRAVARLILGRPDAAAADLGRARTLLEQAGDRHGVLSAENNMGLVELTRLRPAQAVARSGAAAAGFESIGALHEALSAQTVTMEAHLALLQWREALAVNDRGWALRGRIEDPDVELSLLLARARVLLGLGRLADAAALLEGVEARFAGTTAWNRAEMQIVLAEQAWIRGHARAAAAHARHALALQPGLDSDGRRAFAGLLAVRAQRAAGEPFAARLLPPDGPLRLLAQAEAAASETPAAGNPVRGYAAALELAESRGVPAEIALVAASYGRWLLDRGEVEEAAAVIGRIAPSARHDFECALMQVALFHHRGDRRAWERALGQARALAGERVLPARWTAAPSSFAPESTTRRRHQGQAPAE